MTLQYIRFIPCTPVCIYIYVCVCYIYIYARVRVCIKVQQFKSCRSQCTPTTRCCRLFFEFPALCAAQGMALGIRAHLTEPMGMEVSPQGGYVLNYICVTPMAMYNVQIHHHTW